MFSIAGVRSYYASLVISTVLNYKMRSAFENREQLFLYHLVVAVCSTEHNNNNNTLTVWRYNPSHTFTCCIPLFIITLGDIIDFWSSGNGKVAVECRIDPEEILPDENVEGVVQVCVSFQLLENANVYNN